MSPTKCFRYIIRDWFEAVKLGKYWLRKYPEEALTKSTLCPTTLLYDVSGDSWLSEASYAECCAIHLEVCIASDCRIQNSVVNYMDWASTCGGAWSQFTCFVTAQIKTCINLYGVYTYLYPLTYTLSCT